jgi:hypothetical protein
MTAFGLAVVYGLVQRRAWAWPGVCFLLALAPSSSFLPLGQIAADYRMYLALTAVVAAAVLGIHAAIGQWVPSGPRRVAVYRGAVVVALAAVGVLTVLTQNRNRLYATPGGVWIDVIEQGTGTSRALWNLALACDEHHAFDTAIQYAGEVAARNRDQEVYAHLAMRRLREGDLATAERYLREAVGSQSDGSSNGTPIDARIATCLAKILRQQGRNAEADEIERRSQHAKPE